jgi:plasmid stability protein
MSSLLIKNIPESLRKKLKEQAEINHRSMNKQVVSILEQALVHPGSGQFPPPVKLKFKVTNAWLNKAKRWGRL